MKKQITDQGNILNAWNYATVAHNGQCVPGTDYPYINHVGSVAMEAMAAVIQNPEMEDPELLILCAILHDIIEDTEGTYEDIEQRFGRSVADGVAALTKNTTLPGKESQMKDSIERIRKHPKEVWMVKLCDRITNLQAPPSYWSAEKIIAYRDEAVLILEFLGAADAYLGKRLRMKIDGYGPEQRQSTV
jgi:(p)ppGpp synthase/HD superfamily hydrolase